ncbi:MAG: DUF1987 domain-containing protein [Sphingobacteriaceae bacterium]|nr:DUF1987 domain-containing protein [Sphingobacteriaceae bacterium]MBK7311492.1 DUF1987 domain-containing protein [Sphingobacteriaceae bacterium]
MEVYICEATVKTPAINFDLDSGTLEIRGRSTPEDTIAFYKPFLEAMDKYANSPQPTTVVTFELEYFNTSSSRSILSALRKLQSIHLAGSAVTINWLYEETDDDILEAGIEYGDIINIPFNMIKIDE